MTYFNDSPAGFSSTYGALVTNALRRRPSGVALIADDGTEMTYPEAYDLFGRIRAVLHSAGVTYKKGFGLLSANRPDAWLTQWAGVANGGRVTPLHPFGSLDDHLFIAKDADVSVIVVDPADHEDRGRALAEALPETVFLTLGPSDYGQDLLALAAEVEPEFDIVTEVTADDTAMVIYTSGTTGRSKGVILPHRAIVSNHLLQLADWPWPDVPRFLASAPISHATGWFPLGVMWKGGTLIMQRRFDRPQWLKLVAKHKVNMTFCVPSMVYALLDDPQTVQSDLSSLELLVYGGAPMTVPRLIQGMEVFGPIFLQLYGQSESPNVVTTLLPKEHDPAFPERLGSCGRPSTGIELRLLDDEGNEVEQGTVGELCTRGSLVMDGYRGMPEETEKTLKGGWLHSGDLGVADPEGYITLVSRSKDVIITGGFNVYPAEVEAPLLTHPAVEAAAVVGLPDDRWGEAVTAFVVLKAGAKVDIAELKDIVRERKGPICTPKAIYFIDQVPLTDLGKPNKKALRVPGAVPTS
jgi:fatty-acyl-CoA synthase